MQSPDSCVSATPRDAHVDATNTTQGESQAPRGPNTDHRHCLDPLQISRANTPWNPQNLMVNAEQGHGSHRPPLSRAFQRILGEFPVEHGRSGERNAEPKGLQDPLWRITGLCERGWNLHGVHGAEKSARDPNAPIPTWSALPAIDAHLLSKWTPQALQGIEREQEQFIMYGMYGSKCDVAHALDPIHHGLLTEPRASELFRVLVDQPRRRHVQC